MLVFCSYCIDSITLKSMSELWASTFIIIIHLFQRRDLGSRRGILYSHQWTTSHCWLNTKLQLSFPLWTQRDPWFGTMPPTSNAWFSTTNKSWSYGKVLRLIIYTRSVRWYCFKNHFGSLCTHIASAPASPWHWQDGISRKFRNIS